MSETIKHFSNRRGTADIISDGIFYKVQIVTYGNLRTGTPTTLREYRDLDGVIAGEYYAASVAELKNKPIVPPKTYCAKCGRACNEFNCPKKMGGADYYKIFQQSCFFRRSR